VGDNKTATSIDLILPANVLSLEALCAMEDCLAHTVPVGFVFFVVIGVPKSVALIS